MPRKLMAVAALVVALSSGRPATCRGDYSLLVTDQNTNQVDRVSSSGTVSILASTGLSGPSSFDFDRSGNLYVANYTDSTVHKFSPTGTDLGNFAAGLKGPTGLAFDSSGNLFVAEYLSGFIHKYSASGTDLGTFASGGSGPDKLAFDPLGNLYVSNLASNAIREFSPAGSDLGNFVTGRHFTGLTFDASGNLYAIDQTNLTAGQIRRYSPSGMDLGVFATGFNSLTDLRFTSVPEPQSILLLGVGLASLICYRQASSRGRGFTSRSPTGVA